MTNYALIPARSGSQRISSKNLVEVQGHPLLAYSISRALECGKFSRVIVSTDSNAIRKVALQYGAEVPDLRPASIAHSNSPDIEWVKHALSSWIKCEADDVLTILRPTNPLRTSLTLRKALNLASQLEEWDSIRAVRPIKEHPRKMWMENAKYIEPFLPERNEITKTESHSSPMQTLQSLLVQDASLEICKVSTILLLDSLSGKKVVPFRMPDYEGYDINYLSDLEYLEYLIKEKKVILSEPKKCL
jgi:CMP-N,N'-diacetyllegionaminic acid synthase